MVKLKYPVLQDRDWLERQVKLKSLRLIAQEIGSSYGAISYTVRKFGIEIPKDAIRQKRPTVDLSEKSRRGLALKYPEGRFGSLASNWRGGRKKTGNGYIYLYMPDHMYSTKEGYIMEHRWIAQQKIGRIINPDEQVHHINGIKDDNRPENLEVVSHRERSRNHADAVKEVERLKKILEDNKIKY